MVAYKKSTSAMILSAAVAAAQNGTIPYPVETEITYTTVIRSLCPTGLIPQTYTIKQHCDYLPCEQPAVPYGWEVKTKWCEHGCGPAPTYVPVTECPWENPAPTPACYGADCYKDEVVCPEGNTYTNWYLKPTPAPQPQPPKEEYPPTEYPPTEYPPTEYPPTHEGEEYPPKHEQPQPYPPKQEQPYPPKHEQPKPYPPKQEQPYPPKHEQPQPYPPKQEQPYPPKHEQPKPYPPPVHTQPMPVPSAKPQPTPYTPPTCEGPHCPSVYPEVVTKVYPPTKPEVPCNTTTPYPPMYTGAAVKTAASGVLGFAVVALAAFL